VCGLRRYATPVSLNEWKAVTRCQWVHSSELTSPNDLVNLKTLPPAWKKAVSILIYKKGDKGCIAGQLTDWLTTNKVLSP